MIYFSKHAMGTWNYNMPLGFRTQRCVICLKEREGGDVYCWCCSVAKLCPTLCNPMNCSTPGFPVFTISWSLLKLTFTELVIPSNHLILCYPLLLPPSIFPSISVFSSESALCIRWPKYWSFSLSVLPMSTQGWFPLGLTGLIFLQSKGLSRVFSRTTVQRHQFLGAQPFLSSSSRNPYMNIVCSRIYLVFLNFSH